MKKAAATVILIFTAVSGIGLLWHLGHGISLFARTDYGDKNTNSHSRREIGDAVSMARNKFRNFEGCMMTELRYSEELSQQETAYYNDLLKCYIGDPNKWVDDVIVLESTFSTSKVFSEPTFNGCTQRGWKWVITHTPERGWELKDGAWGYA